MPERDSLSGLQVPVHRRTSEKSRRNGRLTWPPLHTITIAHMVLIDRRGGRPRPNENWRLRIRCASSTPVSAIDAL